MSYETVINELQRILGKERSEAYKKGFTHGVEFAENKSTTTLAIIDKAFRNVLSQVDNIYGQGKEYKVLVECLEAITSDILSGKESLPLEYYWDDDEADM